MTTELNMLSDRGTIPCMTTFLLLLLLATFTSCGRDKLELALTAAGDNREEMEKVLDHFRESHDTLRYGAAKFIIENMPVHSSFSGEGVLAYDSAYTLMAQEPTQHKDSVFAFLAKDIKKKGVALPLDVQTLKADFLIRIIDEACDVWQQSPWHKDYDIRAFYEYVLPYSLLNEPVSQWRDSLRAFLPFLFEKDTRSFRGAGVEAESSKHSTCKTLDIESASGRQASLFDSHGDSLSMEIFQPLAAKKTLRLCYSTGKKNSRAFISMNGKTADTLYLPPTFSLETFNDRRAFVDVELEQGNNRVTIAHVDGQFCVDYIHLAAIEDYVPLDFSDSYQHIQNKATGHFIAFDTLRSSLLNRVEIVPAADDSLSMLRLDHAGYGCWRVACFKRDSIDLCLDVFNFLPAPETPIVQWKYVGANNQKWMMIPVGDGYFQIISKDNGLVLTAISNDATGREEMVQRPYAGLPCQQWKIIPCGKRAVHEEQGLPSFGSAIAEAYRIFDVTNLFEWFYFKGDIPPKASTLMRWRTGECRDETSFTVYLSRALGIPAAIDFTPHWGNRSGSHTWSVLIPPKGKAVTFYMGAAPGDTTNLFHGYKKPKVYRRQYSLNRKMMEDLQNEECMPALFETPFFTDVTAEYCPTSDIVRRVPAECENSRVLYICVFDNEQWVPVDYGVVSEGEVKFSSMGREIMYVTATFKQGKAEPMGEPYYVTAEGVVKDVVARAGIPTTLVVNRKYPFMGKEDFFNFRMWGGRFQGANKKDFSDATNLHVFEGMTNGNWYEEDITAKDSFRFLRYIGPNGSFCNINEMTFFDGDGKELEGRVIGTEGVTGAECDKVFDRNILTGFHSVKPDGGWVGLELRRPSHVGKIRFIPRNDGNCVEVGDDYELCYWHNGEWLSLGEKVATEDLLSFSNVPSGALYLLHDHTKGREERIFTYEDGRQVWW